MRGANVAESALAPSMQDQSISLEAGFLVAFFALIGWKVYFNVVVF